MSQGNCSLCGKSLDPAPLMSGEQRLKAWLAAIGAVGVVCMGSLGLKACERSMDVERERIPVDARAKAESARAEADVKAAEARAHAEVRNKDDRIFNEAQRAKAEAQRAEAEAKTAEAQAREASRREIYKLCLGAANDPALCSGQLQTVRCLPTTSGRTNDFSATR